LAEPDEHYINPRLAAVYDNESGWSEDRQFYLELAGDDPIDILDFGCGTGLIANAYAERGHRVTGADPASAMLEIARKRAPGNHIEWIEATSQDFRSDKRFDLIIMTGHAFQVLLEPQDVSATLQNVRKLLKPSGRFVFETRNPKIDWIARWTHERHFETEFGPLEVIRRITKHNAERIRFDTRFCFPDGEFTSRSELRFWTEDELRTLIGSVRLAVIAFYGDWQKGSFEPGRSEEMIFEVGSP
jgi:ubiquinone/menaquinone biosynthesis C-methylase UbiE